MMASTPIGQPPSGHHPAPRKSSQELAGSSYFDGPSVHTQPIQHYGCLPVGGLPSPAPSCRAASPPDGPNHDAMLINCSWVPISPVSPAPCEGVDGELNYALEIAPCASTLVASHSGIPGLYSWGEVNLPYEFEHAC
ncbi:uncharacterized protein B0T15DRAFT_13325 [Chaetomium strumarium]|uniref:Uncharacterized protein n=1 Tax=Chaetomium strumarium TaxID=1170767 RepID=A0AAJ0H0V2_9PEZI|nr:hypothetical protein B0T15DRAFT_13325 [Chaetomium strumarium]